MMIKAPRPGASKTRLTPPLTPAEAAALSTCFLRDTAENIASAGAGTGVAVFTPAHMASAFDGLLPAGFAMAPQRGNLFGERLLLAAEDLLALGYGSVCLIDSDSPTLPPDCLRAAVAALESGDRVVLGPSEDGGYYLIGVRAAHARLFEEIDWSTGRVAAQTLERARELGLEAVMLPTWYDVDDAPTLRQLCEEMFGPRDGGAPSGYPAPRTREFLTRLIETEGRERIWPRTP
jgi:rSAM/selenodomain-associated transferase 1